jgi:tetratricopeptide (TPR) repeat protein
MKSSPLFCWVLFFAVSGVQVFAQQTDRVEVVKGSGRSLSGKITQVTPFGVSVQSAEGTKQFTADQISKLIFQGQPLEIERARSQMNSGRYDGAIEELQKISQPPKRPEIKQEIDFLMAKANAELAFRGSGSVTAQDAGRGINEFIRNNPQSMHLFPATELLGRLLFSVQEFELAEKEFVKLNESKWPEYVLKGNFLRGESLVEQGKFAEAVNAYQSILDSAANDDLTLNYKLLAKARLAKANALAGNDSESIKTLEELIRVENAENAILFAYTYNSLGSVYLKQDNLKEAMLAFLHTDLLYNTEREAHAEALYNLAQIWPKLDQIERANQTRQNLKNLHRNSVWALKLQQQ